MTHRQITFTLDLEDHRPSSDLPKRYDVMTEKILVFLAERNIRATVFVVGTLAENDPGLIRQVAAKGHEIAIHSYDHTPIVDQSPETFRHHTEKSKKILEDITGQEVIGYRAPVFSLTKQSLWAVDILKELDLLYSSSILPASNPLFGFPELSSSVFRWANGLLEIPAPIGHLGPFDIPYLGGFYLRYLPVQLIARQIQKANDSECLWTYCHPYDFDDDEKNFKIKGAATWVSLLLWFNRKNTLAKFEKLVSNHGLSFSTPFKEQINQGYFDNIADVIDPVDFA